MRSCRQCGGSGGHLPACPNAYDRTGRPGYPVATGLEIRDRETGRRYGLCHAHAEVWQHADRIVPIGPMFADPATWTCPGCTTNQ